MANAATLVLLKSEITVDPITRGYSGMTDVQVAESLNTVNRNRNRVSMPGDEIGDSIDEAEWDALSDINKDHVLGLMGTLRVDPFGFGASVIKKSFGLGSTTVGSLAVARVETISRGVEIGVGQVSVGHVEYVRNN